MCYLQKTLRWTILLPLVIITSSLSAQKAKLNSESECSGSIKDNDLRFQNLFPRWVKTIAIISPASPADTNQVDAGIRLLQNAGIRVKVMPHARERENTGYTPIDATKRIADLEQAWLDPEVDLLLCTRGGVGTEDLLALINWDKLRKRDMPLVGFSNITALHCAMLNQKAGHSYSGPSLTALIGCDQESLKRFRETLGGQKQGSVQLGILRAGKCSGVAFGGHLMLLEKISRTPFCPDTTGKIIFIECPGQKMAVLQDKLNKLRDTGFFKKCEGIVFGHFTNCGSPSEIAATLQDFSKTVTCPVFTGYPYGHKSSNYMIDFRRSVSIDENGIIMP